MSSSMDISTDPTANAIIPQIPQQHDAESPAEEEINDLDALGRMTDQDLGFCHKAASAFEMTEDYAVSRLDDSLTQYPQNITSATAVSKTLRLVLDNFEEIEELGGVAKKLLVVGIHEAVQAGGKEATDGLSLAVSKDVGRVAQSLIEEMEWQEKVLSSGKKVQVCNERDKDAAAFRYVKNSMKSAIQKADGLIRDHQAAFDQITAAGQQTGNGACGAKPSKSGQQAHPDSSARPQLGTSSRTHTDLPNTSSTAGPPPRGGHVQGSMGTGQAPNLNRQSKQDVTGNPFTGNPFSFAGFNTSTPAALKADMAGTATADDMDIDDDALAAPATDQPTSGSTATKRKRQSVATTDGTPKSRTGEKQVAWTDEEDLSLLNFKLLDAWAKMGTKARMDKHNEENGVHRSYNAIDQRPKTLKDRGITLQKLEDQVARKKANTAALFPERVATAPDEEGPGAEQDTGVEEETGALKEMEVEQAEAPVGESEGQV